MLESPASCRLNRPQFESWMAAFLHDYLYRSTNIPKDVCDSLLREAMEDLCVDWVERDAIYEGVALGGQSSFDEDRKPLPVF